ncbi:MAG: hypothetical protein KAH93_02385 [Candidatus Aenigmarchaeota archaeon]|nr:hypothetical protein [Candidatus Aenigmarchaeota archaeon]
MLQKQRGNKFWNLYGSSPQKLSHELQLGLFLDTEPLIIYLVGLYDSRFRSNYLGKFNRQKIDFTVLARFFQQMKVKHFIVTPQILAEFWSLTKNNLGGRHPDFIEKIIPYLKNDVIEEYVKKDVILESDIVTKYGITDIGTLTVVKNNKYPALICEWALSGLLEKNDAMVIYFEQLKELK